MDGVKVFEHCWENALHMIQIILKNYLQSDFSGSMLLLCFSHYLLCLCFCVAAFLCEINYLQVAVHMLQNVVGCVITAITNPRLFPHTWILRIRRRLQQHTCIVHL